MEVHRKLGPLVIDDLIFGHEVILSNSHVCQFEVAVVHRKQYTDVIVSLDTAPDYPLPFKLQVKVLDPKASTQCYALLTLLSCFLTM